jgi:hypothetical protein
MELERILKSNNADIRSKQAGELTERMYQIKSMLPASGKTKEYIPNMDEKQRELYTIILKNS